MMSVTTFSLLNWLPARFGRSTSNDSFTLILSRFLPFTGAIAEIDNKKIRSIFSVGNYLIQIIAIRWRVF